jgi:hypothetical protein
LFRKKKVRSRRKRRKDETLKSFMGFAASVVVVFVDWRMSRERRNENRG